MKRHENGVIREYLSRKGKTEEQFDVVGAEIRDRRLQLSRTQASLSDEICSTSYLCKIEKNKIIPNAFFLEEICKKLEMKDEKIKALLNLRNTLERVIKAFLVEDIEQIRFAYEEGKGLNNYRFKIIELVYYISTKKLMEANKISNELIRLVGTMADYDLSVFSLFYGILSYYNQDFELAIEDLSQIKADSIDLRIVQELYLFYAYCSINNPCCIIKYYKIRQSLIENGYINQLDKIYYILGIYLLKNGHLNEYKFFHKLIKKDSFRRSLSLLAKIIYNKKMKIERRWLENVEPFFYYLGLIFVDFKQAKEEIDKLNDLCFSVDFNLLYLQYLIIENDAEKYQFISMTALPSVLKTNDMYAKKFFLNESLRISKALHRYKLFNDIYTLFHKEAI